MEFRKAQRKRAKLRLALAGPSGSGKTWGALMIAKGLGGKIAVIDTERGSASLYSDLLEFDTLELEPPFHPRRFVQAIHAAEKAGYDVIVVDSITHEWNGAGGCLEINETLAQAKYKGNTWSAWNETTPLHREFVDTILQTPCHIIATMRTKTETAQIEEGGRKKVVKLGMKAEQREGMEYEYAVVFDLEHEKHWATASKDRTRLFTEPHKIGEDTGKRLLAWLEAGAPLAPIDPTVDGLKVNPRGDVDAMDPEKRDEYVSAITGHMDNIQATTVGALREDDAAKRAFALYAELDDNEKMHVFGGFNTAQRDRWRKIESALTKKAS